MLSLRASIIVSAVNGVSTAEAVRMYSPLFLKTNACGDAIMAMRTSQAQASPPLTAGIGSSGAAASASGATSSMLFFNPGSVAVDRALRAAAPAPAAKESQSTSWTAQDLLTSIRRGAAAVAFNTPAATASSQPVQSPPADAAANSRSVLRCLSRRRAQDSTKVSDAKPKDDGPEEDQVFYSPRG